MRMELGDVVVEDAPDPVLAIIDSDEGDDDWAMWCRLIQGNAHRKDEMERQLQMEGLKMMRSRWMEDWRHHLEAEGIKAPRHLPTSYRYTDLIEYAPPSVRDKVKSEAKAMGDRCGIPDVLVLIPRKEYCGLAIECKAPRGWLLQWQKTVMQELRDLGWCVVVCRSAEAMVTACEEYLL